MHLLRPGLGLAVVMGLRAIAGCGSGTPPPAPPAAPPGDPLGLPPSSATVATAADDAGTATASSAPPIAPATRVAVTVLVKDLHAPDALALDQASVYWVDAIDGDLSRVPKRGGVTMMVDPGTGAAFTAHSSLAVDDTDVYFASQIGKASSFIRQDKNGGKPTGVASSSVASIEGVAIDDKAFYWVLGGGIMKESKSGGAPQTLAGGFKGASGIAVDDSHVYWSVRGTEAARFTDGTIVVSDKGGGNARVLVRGAENAENVEVDGSDVYWQSGAKVLKASKTKGELVQLAEASGKVADIAVDDTYVYFLTPDAIARVPKRGGKGQTYLDGLSAPTSIAVDGTSVYFTTRGTESAKWRDGTLAKVEK
jgi:hypothetical protein